MSNKKGPQPPKMPIRTEMKIDRVDSYYYHSGRYSITYVEVTFWYNPHTLERKETTRTRIAARGKKHELPDWAKSITTHDASLDII